jgi:hypothetical protein
MTLTNITLGGAIAAVKKCLFEDKPVGCKGATKYLQFGWLDRIIYWSNEGVVVNASPMMSVPNVAISDHMPVSTFLLSLTLSLSLSLLTQPPFLSIPLSTIYQSYSRITVRSKANIADGLEGAARDAAILAASRRGNWVANPMLAAAPSTDFAELRNKVSSRAKMAVVNCGLYVDLDGDDWEDLCDPTPDAETETWDAVFADVTERDAACGECSELDMYLSDDETDAAPAPLEVAPVTAFKRKGSKAKRRHHLH